MTKSYKQENQYILDCIDNSGYNDKRLITKEEKLQFLFDTFNSEYDWDIKRIGQFKALSEWLQGLPSCINIAFYNHDILELAKKWGSLPENATEKEEDKILNNYWQFIAMRICSLWNKYNIK